MHRYRVVQQHTTAHRNSCERFCEWDESVRSHTSRLACVAIVGSLTGGSLRHRQLIKPAHLIVDVQRDSQQRLMGRFSAQRETAIPLPPPQNTCHNFPGQQAAATARLTSLSVRLVRLIFHAHSNFGCPPICQYAADDESGQNKHMHNIGNAMWSAGKGEEKERENTRRH